ncbi:hypothetical protein B0H15DRAFT_948633 [Mycena belliarum]|uniref:F-box domain-containing protein n=1 Tax=Mycena belliarum TaxID=1033014 RepID=A0AAD6U6A4_9AGAR|nr:hypothetical protein B0H15DRAFT_948633 [Mycena belliae]
MSTLLQLPPEICAVICEDVEQADLLALCRISRLFRDQAQRLIYRTVDLRKSGQRGFDSWCLAVTKHPQLAQRVHTLSLRLAGDISLSSDAAKLARVLGRCLNLKELHIYANSTDRMYEPVLLSIQGWIITKCPFKLTKFTNGYFRNSFISQFWTAQPEIRVLSLPICDDRFPCYDDQLPHLVALEVGSPSALPVDRALQRVQLRLRRSGERLERLSALNRYAPTLTTLNLVQMDFTDRMTYTTLEVFRQVAQAVPALRHFGIAEVGEKPIAIFEEEFSVSDAMIKFTHLETFVFYSKSIVAFRDLVNHRYALDNEQGLLGLGMDIMANCPTLRRAVVGARKYDQPFTDNRWNPNYSDLVWTLTRSTAGGEIEADRHTDDAPL